MGSETCAACPSTRAELAAANKTILALVAEKSELLRENAELNKRVTLLEGDVERYKKAIAEQPTPHQPERVSKDQLQLGLDGVLESLQGQPLGESVKNAVKAANDEPKAGEPSASTSEPSAKPKRGNRRNLLASNLPVINELIDPPEVVMDGFEGWVQLKPEVTLNLARRSPYVVLRIERRRWAKKTPENTRIALADLPPSAAPGMMADAGVIASVVMDKYGSLAPLHRQEQGSSWRGFHLPRSTLSDWCGYAYEALSPIVDAMHADLVRESSVIATDATGAPVRCKRGTLNWHVFTFIGDAQHITFRDVRRHDGASIGSLLKGFSGRLLVDAASIYDRLPERGIQLLSCWSHARRYFWKATKTESRLAHEALSLIDGLFRIDKNAKQMSVGARGEYRAQHSRVLLDALDVWVTSASERARRARRSVREGADVLREPARLPSPIPRRRSPGADEQRLGATAPAVGRGFEQLDALREQDRVGLVRDVSLVDRFVPTPRHEPTDLPRGGPPSGASLEGRQAASVAEALARHPCEPQRAPSRRDRAWLA